MISIVSIQVGLPQTYGAIESSTPTETSRRNDIWTSAIAKSPVFGQVDVIKTGIIGDQVADTQNHGGVDKAILAYSADHYPEWLPLFERESLPFGAFGENLSIQGQDEHTTCLGDQYQIGEVIVEVSQPRFPCWKLSRRWGFPTLTKLVAQKKWTGWYLRILVEGSLSAGDHLNLIHRPHPDWTIYRANQAMFDKTVDATALIELMQMNELSQEWKKGLG